MTFRIKIYTGPVWIDQYTAQWSESGLVVALVGTEHVYLDVVASAVNKALDYIHAKIGWSRRDMSMVCSYENEEGKSML